MPPSQKRRANRSRHMFVAARSAWAVGCLPKVSRPMISALAASPSTSAQPSVCSTALGASVNSAAIARAPAPAMTALTTVWGASSGLCQRSRPSHWLNKNAV